MKKNLNYCPKCQNELVKLDSGKLVCRSCSWSSKNDSNNAINEINLSDKITMRGIILTYDKKLKKGLISGDDGKRYELLEKEWTLSTKPQEGLHIDFEVTNGRAYNILLIPRRGFIINAPIFSQLLFMGAGLYLIFSGISSASVRGESERDGSTSFIAEQVRNQGRLQIGLGLAILGFNFCVDTKIKSD